MQRHSVYVVASEIGLTKIGIASDVKSRISSMRVDSPILLELFNYFEFSSAAPRRKNTAKQYARRTETLCHNALAEFHHHGEWFKIAPELAWQCVQDCVQKIESAPELVRSSVKRLPRGPRHREKTPRPMRVLLPESRRRNQQFIGLLANEREPQ